MTTFANHSFAKRSLNVRDENGNEGCAICGRPRGAHPPDNQESPALTDKEARCRSTERSRS